MSYQLPKFRHPELPVNDLGYTKADYIKIRSKAEETISKDDGWMRWHRMGGSLRLRSGHAFMQYWDMYGKDHPEWFALQPNGSRDQSRSKTRARFCSSNIELIAEIAKNKINELRKNPGFNSVSIGPNNGASLTFCVCESCKKLDPPGGKKIHFLDRRPGEQDRRIEYVSLTDRMFFFWNEIAKRVAKAFPDALLVADAYSAYSEPRTQCR